MPWGEISNCAVYALPVTLQCPESEIQALLYFTFKTTAENNFHFLHFCGLGLMDNDNEKLLRLSVISNKTMAVDLSVIRKKRGHSPLSFIWTSEVATQIRVDREAQETIRALLYHTVLLTVFLLVPEAEFPTDGNLTVLKFCALGDQSGSCTAASIRPGRLSYKVVYSQTYDLQDKEGQYKEEKNDNRLLHF
ncbi:hypothetical protein BTVI_82481 [Pitangus sulphuratus]|nr:hypothetical protein BTVI_82481 [Pitangus sulphuratus]